MPAPKGTIPPNAGKGRPLGSKNKVDAEQKLAMDMLLAHASGDLIDLWDTVKAANPDKALALYDKFLEYRQPKLARTELVGDGGGPVVHRMDNTDLEL